MAKLDKPEVDAALVRRLAQLLGETGLTELEYATEQWRIRVARQPTPVQHVPIAQQATALPAQPATAVAGAETPPESGHPGAVLSPMVGTVYLLPEPGAAPFVQLGDQVKAGQTLLIVEAMKVMNPVAAPRAGRVARIAVENGAPVEYGAVLMIIE
jgi:acetyl-CoA carboxylase biotin carboxyl carrier protein